MVVQPRVKIRPRPVNHDFVHQTGIAKSAQGVVNGGKADLVDTSGCGGIKPLGGDVAVHAIAHQQSRQSQSLPRRTQTAARQPIGQSVLGRVKA